MDEGTGTTTSGGWSPDPAWSPTSLPGFSLWLDAADSSTITGNPVTAWADKSGNNISLTSTTGPASGTRNLNGKNVLDFDGTKTIGVSKRFGFGHGWTGDSGGHGVNLMRKWKWSRIWIFLRQSYRRSAVFYVHEGDLVVTTDLREDMEMAGRNCPILPLTQQGRDIF